MFLFYGTNVVCNQQEGMDISISVQEEKNGYYMHTGLHRGYGGAEMFNKNIISAVQEANKIGQPPPKFQWLVLAEN